MSKVTAKEVASYLFKKPECHFSNTFDGNMKLQKLLVFANIIHFIQHGKSLFPEKMYAFKNGIVIEDVRVPFYHDHYDYTKSLRSLPDSNFSDEELDSINTSISLFNKLSAKELSDLHHEFKTWKIKYEKSKVGSSYDKRISLIENEEILQSDLSKMKKILNAYSRTRHQEYKEEKINGITFYYYPGEMVLSLDNEDMMNLLEDISRSVTPGEGDTFFLAYDEQQGLYYY